MKNLRMLAWCLAVVLLTVASVVVWKSTRPNRPASAAVPTPTPAPAPASATRPEPLSNVDRRGDSPAWEPRQNTLAASRADRLAAAARLEAQVPGVRVDFDEALASPKFVASTRGFLATAPAAADDPPQVVETFLDEHAAMFGHNAAVLEDAKLVRDYATEHNGLRTLVWQQQLAGVRVFESTLQAHVTKNGELVNIASRLVPNPATAATKTSEHIDVKTAVSAAGKDVGDPQPTAQIAANAPPEGPSRKQRFRSTRLLDISAETVWLPEDETSMRLCWEVIFTSKARGEMFRSLVDAETGAVVVRQGLTESISDATYHVFTSDSPSPFSPGHPTPLTTQPPVVARTAVTTPALNTTASPNGWIDDGVNETRGNNVDAHADRNADNIADTPRPQGSPFRVFNPPLDLALEPVNYTNAAVVDLFYWNNLIHDRFYELGFTEAAGNFQNNNFSRGGNGNDAVQADAQDGSGTNNANFSTPPDGSPGRMQMYVFDGPTPDRDGDFDHEIVIHEYTHGLSNRLVGGGVGLSNLQSRGMGEGWSDFYALCLLSEPADNANGVYSKGGYATYQLGGMTTNYYFGIRRYPYSTDLTKNPLTFRDIDPTQASPHTGVPLSPRYGSSNSDPSAVHGQGTVWCVTLWDVRANLIAKHGGAAGNQLMLRLVTDGMKLSPANPNFLQARDGIIQADLVNNSGANFGELWSGFAKRGMGSNATSPSSNTTTGVVESYQLPDALAITPPTVWNISGTIGGPFTATNTYTLVNSGTASLNWAAAKSQPWLLLSATSGTLAAGTSTTVVASIAPAANALGINSYTDSIVFTNTTSGFAHTRGVALTVEPIMVPIASENWESGTASSAWAITGTNVHRTLVTTANAPHGGSYHLTMDASTMGLARNEATWTVNLAGRSNVRLRFWLKMFADEAHGPPTSPFTGGADFDGVAISADGTTWYEVQPLRTLVNAWTQYTVNLDAAIAANGLSYNSTFRIRFNHYDDNPISTDGFAFDDIELFEAAGRRLNVSFPASAEEGAGTVNGTVSVAPTPSSDLTVNLTSSAPGQASVPASVLVSAGQASVPFTLTLVDDTLLDGTQPVTIAATATAFVPGVGTIAVEDNETAVLTLYLPAFTSEGAAPIAGTVKSSPPPDTDVVVTLASSNPAELAPTTVTLPAGQASVNFNLPVIDDPRIDGAVTTTITAQVTNWTASTTDISVADNENTALVVTLPGTALEGGIPISGSVQIAGTLPTALTVSLASSDPSELTVPASITIPAGQTSASFYATIVDDTDTDGAQSATVTASAAAFGDGTATVSVADNDPHHFAIGAVGSPKGVNGPFTVTVSARDVNDVVITNFNAPVALTTTSDDGAVPVSPTVLTTWTNGTWTGSVTITGKATNVRLLVDDGQGHTGTSNPFDVDIGPFDHFAWAPIASPQRQENFFPVTITAQDSGNNTIPSFNGPVNLQVEVPNTVPVEVGTSTTTWDHPLHTVNHDARLTSIYLPAELGGARRFTSLALYVTTPPGQALNAWTIRMKHSSYVSLPGPSWEGTGWTTVHQGNPTIAQAGWVTFQFATPFDYDGVSSLMIDFSHNNTSASTSGMVYVTIRSGIRSMYYATDGLYGDPLTWSGLSAPADSGVWVPNVRLGAAAPSVLVPANPPVSGSFVNGSWTGDVAVPFTGTELRLVADDGAEQAGRSDAFAVQAAPNPPGPTAALFGESFEGAVLGAWWTITGTNNYRTLLTTANTPRAGAKHLTMDSTSGGARNEATLTVNLAGRSGVTLTFWAKMFGDEPNGPPAAPFVGGADFDGVAISADGTNWYEVQGLRTLTSVYTQLTVDLDAAIAARGLSYNSNFKIRFNQYDDSPISTDGIAFDDIVITALQTSSATVSLPAQVAENAGTATGSVSFATPRLQDTVVTLVSSANARASVPASVTVPAGQSSANFTLTVLDNPLLDGNRNVAISATPPDNIPAVANVLVVDDDIPTLTLTAPASATEGAGVLTGTATLGAVPSAALTFALTSSDTTEVTVPATITFAPGRTSADFAVTIVNDTVIDGTQTATLTASATGWASATASVTVLDNENMDLTLTLPATAVEGSAPLAGTVRLSGTLSTAVVVDLSSTDTTELTVPSTVTIPAGATTVAFSATVIDDTDLDGTQSATVSASAAGFTGASRTVTINDNDAHHFVVSAVPAAVLRGAPFTLTVTAKDANDVTVTSFSAPTNLLAAAGAAPLSVTPATLTGFVNGVWTGPVKVNDYGTGVVLTVDSAGHTGTSNSFDVGYGPVVDLAWNTIASPQSVDAPFPVTIRAVDAAGNSVPTFTAAASLAAVPTGPTLASGTSANTTSQLFYGSYHDTRMQAIYPASDLGGAATLSGISINISSSSATVFNNFTVRLKHTTLSSFSSASFDASGWTEVYRGNVTPSPAGWLSLPFPTAFNYDGTSNLIVDFSTDNSATGTSAYVYYTTRANRVIAGYASSTLGDPRTWSGAVANAFLTSLVPNVRFTTALLPLPITPNGTGAFVAGEWTGEVTVPAPATSVKLRATSGALTEDSNLFPVLNATPPTNGPTVFSEDFESGVFSGAWTITGTGNFRTINSNTNTPRGGLRHMTMDVLSYDGYNARNEATLTLNLAGRSGVVLSFWAKGFNDVAHGPPASPFPATGADFDGVAISADGGTNWYEVQPLRTLTSSYVQLTVDLDAALAARGLSYNSTFKIRFNQYGYDYIPYNGIAIDDILVTAPAPVDVLTVTLPAQVIEGGTGAAGSVSTLSPVATDLVLELSSKSPAKITVPPTVTIPAGQSSASFPLTVLDDSFVDGNKNVVITAVGAGYLAAGATIQVVDNDTGALSLTLPASTAENAGPVSGTLAVSVPAVVPLTVTLASDNPVAAQVPATVIVPPGATSVTFIATIPDDNVIDGDQAVQISASLAGWTSATANLLVVDNELRTLTVSIPSVLREGDAPKTGTVILTGTTPVALVVSLGSSDATAVTVPASVTIPAGQSSAPFTLTVTDDPTADGAQPFTITASAATFTNGTATGQVRDNEAHHFTFAPIGSPEVQNGPIPAIVTARDALGAVQKDYNSTITLTATSGSGPLTVTPATTNAFLNGVWNGTVQINALATGVVLTASDGLGHTGSSNPFNLVAGSIDRFVWDTVASPQTVDTPFTTTVRAVNAGGATVTGFNGLANLSAGIPSEDAPIGTGTSTYSQALSTFTHDSRTQVIFLASELAGSKRITGLALNPNAATNETLTNFTIRLKHTSLANFSSPAWETAGWTTVYRANPVISSPGWMMFNFTTPFDYDGTSHLLVDWSMDRTSSSSTATYIYMTSTSQAQMVYATSASTNGDPLTWSGTTPSPNQYYARPNVKFMSVKDVPIRPAQTGNFTNGVWTGPVSVPLAGAVAGLKAKSGAISGTSNAFNVAPPSVSAPGGPMVFTEDFESGTLGSAWTITGTNSYRTRVTTENTPHAGARHLTMDTSSGAARNEATLSLNLAGRTGVQLTFWAKMFSDEATGPPASPFTTGADFDGVAISANGTTWWEVQGLRTPTLGNEWAQFTVNLDTAIAARGIAYNSAFKIRFNQYDDSAITSDGIAIDDILVTAVPLTSLAFNLPAQVAEGAGNVNASLSVATAVGANTIVTLASSAPAKVTVPPTVTILAGQTSANFTLTVLDDSIVDGNRTVAVTGAISSQLPTAGTMSVIDNDTLPIALTAPASVAEGATGQTGTVTLGGLAAGPVTLSLTSSDTTELTVPAIVLIPMGQTSATFPITVVNDTQIDGPQTATITASVAGWVDATASVQVTDNETRILSFSGPYSIHEGQTSNGAVYISGTLPTDLVVTIASSNPTHYSVPASVTILAGQTSASVVGTAVDDSAMDGTQSATITASAATFTSGVLTISAFDNDVHHFNFSTVANPQKTGVPFNVTISARDVNNASIIVFNGTVALSATGTGGPVTISPTATTSFSSGSWTGSVMCSTARTNVQLTATSGGATGTSNAFEVQLSPAISLAPASIALSLDSGATTTRTLAIGNTGGGTLTWNIVAAAPPAADGEAAVEEIDSPATAPLQSALNNLNFNAGLVRAVIPNRYAFSDGVTGTNISDGGNDMYDGGNYLGTNLGANLAYSDNVIATSSLLGAGGRYFTRKYDGLWAFGADVNALTYFEITGNLGADGSGSVDSTVLSVTRNGVTYRGFVKRVYAISGPSVNHLIIVPDNGVASQTVSTNTDLDTHRLSNLTGVTQIYYLLYAGTAGTYIDNTATLGIMTTFLDAVSVPDWISPSPGSGSVAGGNTQNVTLTIDATGLVAGIYQRTLTVNSNDPAQPVASVPVTLTVLDVPRITVTPASGLTASGPRGGPFTPASQDFTVTNPSNFPIPWSVTKSVSWLDLSTSGGTLAAGASATVTATLNSAATGLASGPYSTSLVFTNLTNGHGNTTRPVVLAVNPAAELAVTPATHLQASGPLGGPFTPGSATYTLTNPGDASVAWTASEPALWLNLSATSGALAPGASTQVVATIETAAATIGSFTETIVFTNVTNGRGNTTRTATLQVSLPVPVLAAEPPITGGASNTVSWGAVSGASAYEVQAADNPSFANAIGSGWVTGTSFTFASLAEGATWHYRVRTRHTVTGSTGSWSQTSLADFSLGAATNVSTIATPGSVVLATGPLVVTENFDGPGTAWANTIFTDANGTFSRSALGASTTIPNTVPALPINQQGDLEADGKGSALLPNLPANVMTDGQIEARVLPARIDSFGHFNIGLYLRASRGPNGLNGYVAYIYNDEGGTSHVVIHRVVDGIYSTLYPASSSFSTTPGTENFRLRFDATGQTLTASLWRITVSGGTVNETPVQLEGGTNSIVRSDSSYASGMAGLYGTAASSSNRALFDDVSITQAGGSYQTNGTLVSSLINPSSLYGWRTLSYTKKPATAGTALTVDVLSDSGTLLHANLASGTDLSTIPALASASALRLRANLSTTNTANTPALDDWSVGYQIAPDVFYESAWSGTVVSVQDATPPALSVTSPATVASPDHTLEGTAGDLSGVTAVIVNGISAATDSSFVSWLLPATLAAGPNHFNIVAYDSAVPANVRTLQFTVTRIADVNVNGLPDDWETQYGLTDSDTATGDRDQDGIRNVIEYVLCLDPTTHDGGPGFWTTTEMNSDDNKRYLVLHYRRRIGLAGWTIDVETSTNAIDWSSSPGETEPSAASTPLPDGITEVVHMRVLEPMGPSGPAKAFVRLHVRSL